MLSEHVAVVVIGADEDINEHAERLADACRQAAVKWHPNPDKAGVAPTGPLVAETLRGLRLRLGSAQGKIGFGGVSYWREGTREIIGADPEIASKLISAGVSEPPPEADEEQIVKGVVEC